jgi:hypothetical protein
MPLHRVQPSNGEALEQPGEQTPSCRQLFGPRRRRPRRKSPAKAMLMARSTWSASASGALSSGCVWKTAPGVDHKIEQDARPLRDVRRQRFQRRVAGMAV